MRRAAWLLFALRAAADPATTLGVSEWTGPPAAVDDCDGKLRAAGVSFRRFSEPLYRSRDGVLCGVPQGIVYLAGPTRIRWNRAPRASCGLALALARLETVAQEEAQRALGRRIVAIEHDGTYNCRAMAAYPGWVSEHAYANGIDLARITLAGGREVSVARHFARADRPEGRFLHALARRLYDEAVFSIVLTPAFDRLHSGHFHLDLARYRVDGTGGDSATR